MSAVPPRPYRICDPDLSPVQPHPPSSLSSAPSSLVLTVQPSRSEPRPASSAPSSLVLTVQPSRSEPHPASSAPSSLVRLVRPVQPHLASFAPSNHPDLSPVQPSSPSSHPDLSPVQSSLSSQPNLSPVQPSSPSSHRPDLPYLSSFVALVTLATFILTTLRSALAILRSESPSHLRACPRHPHHRHRSRPLTLAFSSLFSL